jgi:hypothetical protein
MDAMTPDTFYAAAGAAVGAGLLLGALVALFNSWTP